MLQTSGRMTPGCELIWSPAWCSQCHVSRTRKINVPHTRKAKATRASIHEHCTAQVAMLPEELEQAGDRLADTNHGRIAGEHMAARCCMWDQLPSCAILTEIGRLQVSPSSRLATCNDAPCIVCR